MNALVVSGVRCCECQSWFMCCDHGDRLTLTCPNSKCATYGKHFSPPILKLEPAVVTDPRWFRGG